MATIILEHVKGTELPSEWVEKFKLPTDRIFTIRIEPEGLPLALTGEEREKALSLIKSLGGGNEDSEAWIKEIESARTTSELKTLS
ncbi:MAG: hypothetical protein HQK89_14405 [Nitrospirae bacterium]|nr:hypothetical protein [Nitrospirota bacterium]